MASIRNAAIFVGGREQYPQSVTGLILSSAIPILITLYLTQVLYYLFFHPLHRVPGPFLARFSKSWRNIRYFRGTWLEDVVELHQTYGSIARIAPNEVSFVDESALKQLYGHGKPNQKTLWYDTLLPKDLGVSAFTIRDAKLHRQIRGRISAVYSMSNMLSLEPLFQEVLDLNWKKFKEFARQNKSFDLSDPVGYFTFDVVAQLAFGGVLGFIEKQEDVFGIIKSLHDGFFIMANMGDMPGQMWLFNNALSEWMMKQFGGEEMNVFNVFFEWLDKTIEKRMANGLEAGRRRDMLQQFIETKDQNGQPFQKPDVMVEGAVVLSAGADTTTAAILAAIGQVLKTRSVYQKLQKEVDEAYNNLGLADGEEIGFKETEKLPYLSAVIKESMRLHPSVTYQLPRAVPDQGLVIDGHHLPKGITCGISPAAMNRDTAIFGNDAYDFNPERWIPTKDSEEESRRLRIMDGNLTTFGMGSRNCMGKNMALVEVYKFVAQFMRHFDADLVNIERPWVAKSQWFALQKEFWVDLRERTH